MVELRGLEPLTPSLRIAAEGSAAVFAQVRGSERAAVGRGRTVSLLYFASVHPTADEAGGRCHQTMVGKIFEPTVAAR